MNQPTADVRAVLRALLLLTTQVKRIADHTAQGSFTLAPPVVVSTDDAPTTDDDDWQPAYDAVFAYIRSQPKDFLPATVVTRNAMIWRAVAVALDALPEPPAADEDDDPPVACWHTEPTTPCDWNVCRQPERLAAGDAGTDPAATPPLGPVLRQRAEQAAAADANACLAYIKGACDGTTRDCAHPAADEDALRTARRDSLLVLLSRAYRGTLIPEESELLRHHVEAEIRESNTARAVAAGNLRHVQVMYAELTAAQAAIERVRAEVRAMAQELHVVEDDGMRAAVNRVLAALDYSDAEPAELVHPDTEQQVSSPEQVDDIAAVRSVVARTQERCQAVRDREGPGGMINATQILGLLSPTWPDGNYEGAAPGSTEQPTTEA